MRRFVLIALCLIGCASRQIETIDAGPNDPFLAALDQRSGDNQSREIQNFLDGEYQSAPEMETRIGSSVGIQCRRKEVRFRDGQLQLIEHLFVHLKCSGLEVARIQLTGTAYIGRMSVENAQSRRLDFWTDSATLTVLESGWWSRVRNNFPIYCPVENLILGTAYSVEGFDCNGLGQFPRRNQPYYASIVINSGQALQFSFFPHEARGQGLSPDSRVMNTTAEFRRL